MSASENWIWPWALLEALQDMAYHKRVDVLRSHKTKKTFNYYWLGTCPVILKLYISEDIFSRVSSFPSEYTLRVILAEIIEKINNEKDKLTTKNNTTKYMD